MSSILRGSVMAKENKPITIKKYANRRLYNTGTRDGQSLMPINFLRQLIRFYGDSMQMLVPSYLEFTIGKLTSEQAKFRDKVAKNFGGPLTAPLFGSIE
jgi:polyhydroxyalkanoate synthesis regulator protein